MTDAPGARVARAAETLLGAPFRLHGRDPATGLDCVGLVAAALAGADRPARAPVAYRLRNSDISAALTFAPAAGLVAANGPIEPGDVILAKSGPAQHHLLVAGTDGGFVHAHAGLRRVVATPGPLAWPVERHWRLRISERG